MTYSLVSESVVVTAGTVFAVASPDGDFKPDTFDGLYARDTRFLSGLTVTIDGEAPQHLRAAPLTHSLATFYSLAKNGEGMERTGAVSVVRDRYVAHGMHDDVLIYNHSPHDLALTVQVEAEADFADLFEVRRGTFKKEGESRCEAFSGCGIQLSYQRGQFERKTAVLFKPEPELSGNTATFRPTLMAHTSWKLCISVLPVMDGSKPQHMKCVEDMLGPPVGATADSGAGGDLAEVGWYAGPLYGAPDLNTLHTPIDRAYDRAILDLRSLTIQRDEGNYVLAAGLPWFMAIFGRDSIISAMQTKILGQDLMFGTLEALAAYQADEVDEFREAQPGKIPHEIREGELSYFRQVPHSRYYGSVDSTPLFLVLVAETLRWTGDVERIKSLLPAAESALRWIDEFGDRDGDGFVEYTAVPGRALRNQCWKDSEDSISFADGRLAEGSIAVAEVQGYVYAAKQGMADVYEALGMHDRARQLGEEAELLKRRFDDAFWMPEDGFYAIALDGDKQQVNSIASNPGHCLWSGILYPDRAWEVVERLMAPDLFNGWGIRTLSSDMARYHPVSYHNGSVWPHDNSIIAAGFARYGFHDEAFKVMAGIFDAAASFPEHRLPELFAGYPRRTVSFPVPYPAANAPQAWAAGSVLYAVEILLRLRPDGDRLVSDIPRVSRALSLTGVPYRGRKWNF